MTEDEAITVLRDMYSNARYGEKTTQIHLFGIKYAKALNNMDLKTIAQRATGHVSYQTEMHKGMKLAKYVEVRKFR